LIFSSAAPSPIDLIVRRIAFAEPFDRRDHKCRLLRIQIVKPSLKRTDAVSDIFFNPDHMVPYMLPYCNRNFRAIAGEGNA
jgi:hypothetical protein